MLVVMVVCFMTMFAGCQESQAVTPAQIKDYAQQAENYSLMVDASQAIAKQMADTLKATGAIDANLIAKAEKIQAEIDRVQPQIIAIAEKIKSLDYSDTAQNDNITAIFETLQAANTATSGINPYSGIIGVFLLLATMISSFFAKKKASEAIAVKAALEEVVVGNEAVKKLMDEGTKQIFKDAMLAAQSVGTQKTVAAIRNDIAA
jgi:hypothetical protein